MGLLYRLSEIVATVDLFLSFAELAKLSDYVRPEFSDTLAIRNGRHPIHDRLSKTQSVPNHAYASGASNLTVITGPNMSGKSTYLRQLALLQILAQMGSFVPAEYACFRLTDHIFTRIGADDDNESSCSTFTVEMREMSYILRSITSTSLVIIDELGRGTSVDDGIGLCFALCEELLKTKAFIFIATHFKEITHLADLYPSVSNCHFKVSCETEQQTGRTRLHFTYTLVKGRCLEEQYGLHLARLSSLPASIVDDAEQLTQMFATNTCVVNGGGRGGGDKHVPVKSWGWEGRLALCFGAGGWILLRAASAYAPTLDLN